MKPKEKECEHCKEDIKPFDPLYDFPHTAKEKINELIQEINYLKKQK